MYVLIDFNVNLRVVAPSSVNAVSLSVNVVETGKFDIFVMVLIFILM